MADFEQAFAPMLEHEGYPGYVNNPHDHGGETIAGIARKYWPGWKGWAIVDALKVLPAPNTAMKNSADLATQVKDFYRRNFWYPMLDELQSQELANWIFDKGVNCGIRQSVKFLQRALGLVDDGAFGPKTLNAANAAGSDAVERCREQARKFYISLAEKDPTQKQFLKGWLARA